MHEICKDETANFKPEAHGLFIANVDLQDVQQHHVTRGQPPGNHAALDLDRHVWKLHHHESIHLHPPPRYHGL
eukprot:362365-Rhodomonas_salina.3